MGPDLSGLWEIPGEVFILKQVPGEQWNALSQAGGIEFKYFIVYLEAFQKCLQALNSEELLEFQLCIKYYLSMYG